MKKLVLLVTFLWPAALQAQQHISGRVIDAQSRPVTRIEVLLHAVTETTGTDVDTDTTDAKGVFRVDAAAANPNAVYFVAVRYNGELFMGDLLRPPFPADQEYVVQVGVDPVDMRPQVAMPPPVPSRTRTERVAGVVVILAAAAIIGALIWIGLRRRPLARRRWLVELARLEEELAAGAHANGALERRRAELRERLLSTKSG
ncbi:MAG: hypothetical protein ACT443_07380 [Gemmatimonadota bacterium]